MADAVAQLLPLFPAVPLIAAAFALLAPCLLYTSDAADE